ncbi:hypothetical protein TURU_111491 [Turdus rufiventris]|nr:hypothetical protein TURU_111491 [Turdus rufiventris]
MMTELFIYKVERKIEFNTAQDALEGADKRQHKILPPLKWRGPKNQTTITVWHVARISQNAIAEQQFVSCNGKGYGDVQKTKGIGFLPPQFEMLYSYPKYTPHLMLMSIFTLQFGLGTLRISGIHLTDVGTPHLATAIASPEIKVTITPPFPWGNCNKLHWEELSQEKAANQPSNENDKRK